MINSCWSLRLILFTQIFRESSSTVIIIGTGPAGIAAATRLLKNNVTDILILEAENRIGGRINSIEFGSSIVDMGAEWCHGEEDNVVYELIKDYNVLRHTDPKFTIFYSDGEPVDDTLSKTLFGIIEGISADGNNTQRKGITLGEYCTNRYLSAINNLNLSKIREKKIANDFLAFFQGYAISSEGSFSWFEPSAESDFRECPGDLGLNWNGRGFKTILDLMTQKFPNTSTPLPIDDKIILNKEVQKIVWDSKDKDVFIKCVDGSSYHGEYVIFTPSLGVLKERHRFMFEPELPMRKQIAIEKLGIGAVMKIMLLFDTKWWSSTFGANFVWSLEDRNADFYKFTKVQEFFQSQWYTNPHFRGTYSYQTTASRQLHGNEVLARPLRNRSGNFTLMFAGEATHPYYFSTVHGAIETGYREADRVLKILKRR